MSSLPVRIVVQVMATLILERLPHFFLCQLDIEAVCHMGCRWDRKLTGVIILAYDIQNEKKKVYSRKQSPNMLMNMVCMLLVLNWFCSQFFISLHLSSFFLYFCDLCGCDFVHYVWWCKLWGDMLRKLMAMITGKWVKTY